MADTIYFICKTTGNVVEILSGREKHNEATSDFEDLISKWKGRDANFSIISCPVVKSVKIIDGEIQ